MSKRLAHELWNWLEDEDGSPRVGICRSEVVAFAYVYNAARDPDTVHWPSVEQFVKDTGEHPGGYEWVMKGLGDLDRCER